jgi:hypothetical protein
MRVFLTAVLVTVGAALGFAQTDFNWHGQLSPGQTVEIKDVNGAIHATASDSAETAVHATKRAHESDPSSVRIQVVPHSGGVTICAVYPDVSGQAPNTCEPGEGGHMNTRNNDTQVEFDVRVPAGVQFVGRTVNGGITAESLSGDAAAHTVNGSVKLATTGNARANTVNGSLDVTMGRAEWSDGVKFSTVNGGITLRLPSALNAHLVASVVNGSIETDYPITMSGVISRRKLEGTIGNGGQELRVTTVNGSIHLKAQ